MLVGRAFSILRNYRELAFAAMNFNSIEINGTHYSLQRPKLRTTGCRDAG
jgi:uncharacterized protein YecE (DUF72 family)